MIRNYNYLTNNISYRIDSIATQSLITKISDTIEYHKNNVPKGRDICGTVLIKMAESMRPTERTLIEKTEFDKMKPD